MRWLVARLVVPLALAACTTERPQLVGPDILYVATPELVGVEMLRLAGVNGDDVVYDLGSGDGRLVIAAAHDFAARGVGVEIDAPLVQTSRESALKAGVADRVRFLWQDLFQTDLADATVVTLYLRDDVNLKLRPKLLRELRPGTRVVSHDFAMADWTPDRVVRVRGPERLHLIFLWLIPGDVGGAWQLTLVPTGATAPDTLELSQRFQHVKGTLVVGEQRLPLVGTLAGDHLRLVGHGWTFAAQIRSDTAAGTWTHADGRSGDWSGRRQRP